MKLKLIAFLLIFTVFLLPLTGCGDQNKNTVTSFTGSIQAEIEKIEKEQNEISNEIEKLEEQLKNETDESKKQEALNKLDQLKNEAEKLNDKKEEIVSSNLSSMVSSRPAGSSSSKPTSQSSSVPQGTNPQNPVSSETKNDAFIKLDRTEITVEEGLKSEKIDIDFSISDIKDHLVVFTYSDNSIATVSWGSSIKDGFYVHGVKAGTTLMTITSFDIPGASATLKITVTPKVRVKGISLDQTHINGKIGRAYELTPTITPSNAQEKGIIWKSSNEKVATVMHGMVSAVGEGTATITATTVDGNHTATCTIKVTPIPVEGIEITTSPKMNYYKGDTLQIKYRFTPLDATNKKVSWSSSNETIAKVDKNGLVTFIQGIAAKNVIITVKTDDGGFKDTITLYCVP